MHVNQPGRRAFRKPRGIIAAMVLLCITLPVYTQEKNETKDSFSYHELRSFYFDPVEMGEVRDIAVQGEYCYVLVRQFNMLTDAVFQLERGSGRVNRIWGIGNFKSAAIESDGKQLWVLGERNDSFLRIFSFSGGWMKTLKLNMELKGSLHGLGIDNDKVYFSQFDGKRTELCLYDIKDGTFKALYTFDGKMESLCAHAGRVLMYQKSFSAYAKDWLVAVDFNPQRYKVLRFVNRPALGLSGSGSTTFFLSRDGSRMGVHSFFINKNDTCITSSPLRRKMTITYHFKETPGKDTVALLIPCPVQNDYQQVKDLSLVPPPNETVTDLFGNSWVRYDAFKGKKSITMKFDLVTCEAAFTIDKYKPYAWGAIPESIARDYTGKTEFFDIHSPEVAGVQDIFPREYLILSRLMGVRNYLLKTISPGYDDDCSSASCFLKNRKGSERAFAIAFAALARLYGLPARLVGGYEIPLSKGKYKSAIHFWNQIFIPDNGWVDVDPGSDDNDLQNGIAYRSNRYMVMFQGNLDTPDYTGVFTGKDWQISVKGDKSDHQFKTIDYLSGIEISSESVVEEKKHASTSSKKSRRVRKKKKK